MNVKSPIIGLTNAEEPQPNGKEIPETGEGPERSLLLYFRATPIDIQSPCMCRAVYLVSRENGHWVYRLQPGTFEILTGLGEMENFEDPKEPAPRVEMGT